MVYGVLKLLNFAHGDLYMIGAFVGYGVLQLFGGPPALVIPVPLLLLLMFVVAGAASVALGVAIERFAYRPLRDAPRIAPLITALGVSFFLQNACSCSSGRRRGSTTRRSSSRLTPARPRVAAHPTRADPGHRADVRAHDGADP